MTKNIIITALFFALFTIVLYIGLQNPIIGEPDMNNWIMNVTVITAGHTYHVIVYNIDRSSTITHIETIITGTITQYYTITYTETISPTTTTTITQVTPSTTTTTTTITSTTVTSNTTVSTTHVTTITSTTYETTTAPVTIVTPKTSTNSIITMTSKVIAFNWRSIVVWASIVYTDSTVVRYTTIFYK